MEKQDIFTENLFFTLKRVLTDNTNIWISQAGGFLMSSAITPMGIQTILRNALAARLWYLQRVTENSKATVIAKIEYESLWSVKTESPADD